MKRRGRKRNLHQLDNVSVPRSVLETGGNALTVIGNRRSHGERGQQKG